MKMANTILVSDIHLGNKINLVKLLRHTLRTWKFKRLIILGDLLCDSNLKRLSNDEWKFLGDLRELSEQGISVIWIEGNHDVGASDNISSVLGIEVVQKFEWQWNNIKCLAIHGHQFDKLIGGWFSDFISWIYLKILEHHWSTKYFAIRMLEWSRAWQRITAIVADKAIDMAQKQNAHYVFCGHTHEFHHKEYKNVEYYNTGSWSEHKGTLIALLDSGQVDVSHYN
jgi:UDP-2,3-diacylglucosamine pyrophosphatase LpxH